MPCGFSVDLEATRLRVGTRESHCVSSKSPSKVRDRDKGVAGRIKRKQQYHFPLQGKSDFFLQKARRMKLR